MKIIKNKYFIITTFISLFVVSSINAFQQKQVTINSQEIFQAIGNQDNKRAAQLIQEAIKSGVNLDNIQNNNGDTALIWAAMNGNKEIAKLLLDSHVNPDIKNNNSETALIKAAINRNKEIAKLLLDFHANPDIKDNSGDTALIWAARNGDKEIAKLLLDSHTNPDIQDNGGETALILAAYYENKEIAKLLLDSHANPNIKNNNGNTALIWAAYYGNKEIVKLLLDANADLDIKDKNKTALDIVQEKGFHEIVKMIKNEPIKRREFVKKEVNEHLIADLAGLVAEYVISCPK